MSRRDAYLRRTYGITEAEYEKLLAVEYGGCWICGKKPKPGGRRLHVDHDHKLKGREAVRGLLCWSCNRLLQRGSDDPYRLRDAASYLEDYLDGKGPQEVLRAKG